MMNKISQRITHFFARGSRITENFNYLRRNKAELNSIRKNKTKIGSLESLKNLLVEYLNMNISTTCSNINNGLPDSDYHPE